MKPVEGSSQNNQINDRLSSYDDFKCIRIFDDVASMDEELDEYAEDIVDDNLDFDEKDEYVAQQRRNNETSQRSEENISLNNDLTDYELVDKNELEFDDFNKLNVQELQSNQGKSTFYLSDSTTESIGKTGFDKFYSNESVIFTLDNVELKSNSLKSSAKDTKGKLILTNHQLVFMPDKKKLNICELDEQYLSLFNHERSIPFIIPLGFIFELKTSNSSSKYRPLSNVLGNTSTGVLRDILIKCKNFMTKLFFFSNPSNDCQEIFNFITKLIYHSNYQRVINERFKHLIQDVNAKFYNQNFHSQVSQTTSKEIRQNSEKFNPENQKRKSYLIPNDLQQDLVECECNGYMQVKSGYAVVIPDKFKINTNMPFCVLPKNVADIILEKRVVTNEQNVIEFCIDMPVTQRSSTTLSPSANRFSKRASTLIGVSPRSNKSNYDKAIVANQQPILANTSVSNPFFNNQFPVWSFSNPLTGCSLIVVPESASNRQIECDVIIKNYNSLLCDQNEKLKNLSESNRVSIGSSKYNEYEFFKFQVPYDYTDISKSYLKLMEICSFKTKAEYIKTNDSSSFYVRIQNSKWLKKVSTILSLVTKIVKCLHIDQRNVFLEERSNKDCSCIITSLVKICMHQRNRTVIGFENLIQKDWFLVGHLFNKRLQAPYVHDDQGNGDSEYSNHISPTFLLFLDCVFQLIQQYPDEFEFNEIYLIHSWDYACSSLSYTYSFDGIMNFLNYLNNQTFLASNSHVDTSIMSAHLGQNIQIPKFENIFLNEVFEMNSNYWLKHLTRNKRLLVNRNFNVKNFMSILNPNDKIYVLKFWSRCYLRWHEKHHAYKSAELDPIQIESKTGTKILKEFTKEDVKVERQSSVAIMHTRPAPPPPILIQHTEDVPIKTESARKDVSSRTFVTDTGIKVTTRTTIDGNIESSF